jgi:L-aspartate oxidase
MAYDAGAELADMEFVQFHPTALNLKGAPRFLLSEAMRGEGGVLRNEAGRRFMSRYDERVELAPRDIVSRAIVAEMQRTGTRTVYLDMTAFDAKFLANRFPKIYETCLRFDLDISRDLLPVSPAAHYCMGGIQTDLFGRSTLQGLYAAGEVACTGVHGANRLASNSLLEGLVFGARAGFAAVGDRSDSETIGIENKGLQTEAPPAIMRADGSREIAFAVRKRVRKLMWERVGILRTRDGITRALREFEQIAQSPLSRASRNFLNVASLIARSALWREESRGAHFRTDFPLTDNAKWQVHSIVRKDAVISSAEELAFGKMKVGF